METLLVTRDFRSYGLVSRLMDEGHTVKVFGYKIKKPTFGEGMVEFVSHPLEAIKSCRYIIADAPVDDQIYGWAKTFNKPIIGGSPLTDLMNTDAYREYQIAAKLGVPLPPTEVIDDVADMYAKILDWNSTRTVVRYDREAITVDHQDWLAWAMHRIPLNKKILLQTPGFGEHLEVCGWFDGLHWARPFFIKSNNDDRLSASMLLALSDRKWIATTIEPWSRFLRVTEYKGPFKIKLLLTKERAVVISTYTGMEFPSIYAFFEGLKEPISDFLNRVAFGMCPEYDITSDYMASIVVNTAIKEPDGIPIVGLDEGNAKHIFLGSVARLDSGLIIKKGLSWVYTATAHGRDLSESLGRAYFTSKRVQVPEPLLMTNLESAYKPWLTKIGSLGYL